MPRLAPPPSRCRHSLTEVLCCISERFTTSFLQNSKEQKEFNLYKATQLLAEQSRWFSHWDLRRSAHSGQFCKFTLGPRQTCAARDLDCQVESGLPEPSHWFISDLHPPGVGGSWLRPQASWVAEPHAQHCLVAL